MSVRHRRSCGTDGQDSMRNRVRKMGGSSDTYYINGVSGNTEVVNWVPYGYNYTYNILALPQVGNDNIGQVRVNGTVNRYNYLKDHLGSIKMTARLYLHNKYRRGLVPAIAGIGLACNLCL